jgi:hypothetical protein
VLHRLTQEVGCRGMFSTHYHRLATDHASDPTVRFFSCRYAQYIVVNDYYCECSLKIPRDREAIMHKSPDGWLLLWKIHILEDAEPCRVPHGWLFCLLMNGLV